MFCKKCGAHLPDDAAFCMKCGVKVESSEESSDSSSLSHPAQETKIVLPPFLAAKKNDTKSEIQKSTKLLTGLIFGIIIIACGIAFRHPDPVQKTPSETAVQQKSPDEIAAEKKAAKEKADAQKKAHEEAIKPPVTLSRTIITPNVIGEPTLSLIMKNNSQKTINAFKLHIYAYDNYGKQVKQFGYGDGVFSAISQREIEPGGTTSSQYTWTLHGFDNGRKFKVQLYSIHFTDGTEWTAENDQDVSIEGTINP